MLLVWITLGRLTAPIRSENFFMSYYPPAHILPHRRSMNETIIPTHGQCQFQTLSCAPAGKRDVRAERA